MESLVLSHPAVKDCGVIGIPDERSGQVPLAYVVKQNGVDITQQDLIDYVAGENLLLFFNCLLLIMCITERISVEKHLHGGVKFIDEIPKNASGKILRRKLIEMFNTSL